MKNIITSVGLWRRGAGTLLAVTLLMAATVSAQNDSLPDVEPDNVLDKALSTGETQSAQIGTLPADSAQPESVRDEVLPDDSTRIKSAPAEAVTGDSVLMVEVTTGKGRTGKSFEKLDDIEVYGTTEIDRIKSSAMTVSVIDAKRYAGRFVSVDELLKRTAGVDVRRSGGIGSASRITVRGVGGKGLKTFIDGAPLSAVDGIFSLDNLPVQLIDRIEIYKGIAPAHLGADALGGAINVILIDREIDYFEASYSAGSYNTHNGVLRFRKNWTKPGIRLSGGLVPVYAKNDYKMDLSWLYPDLEPVTRNHDRWYWLGYGVGLAFTRLWFDEIEFELEGLAQHKETQGIEQPTFNTTTSTILPVISMAAEKEDFFLEGLDFEYHCGILPLSLTHHVDTTSVFRQWDGTSERVGLQGEMDVFTPHCSYDTLSGTQQRVNISYSPVNHFTFNVNEVFQYIKNGPDDPLADSMLSMSGSDYPSKMLSNSLGLAGDVKLFDDRFLNQLILKVHSLKTEIYGKGISQLDWLDNGWIPQKETADLAHYFGFSEAIRFRPIPFLGIKASYERAVRLPNSAELFGDGAGIAPGLGLKPEVSHNVNVGMQFVREQWLDIPKFEAELNGFFYDTRDKIKLVGSNILTGYKNIQHTRTLGVEGEVKVDVRRWLYLTANATYQDIRLAEDYLGARKGMREPNMPWFFTNVAAEFTWFDMFADNNNGKVFWEGGYTHEFYMTWSVADDPIDMIESSFVMNAGVEYDFSDRLSISAEVNDITDSWKYDVFRQPLPGRTFRLNLHLFLQRISK